MLFLLLQIFFFHYLYSAGSVNNKTIHLRIADGENADIREYPYVVQVYSKMSDCTGALIDASWVLTAGHCVNKYQIHEIIAGTDDKDSFVNVQVRYSRKAFTHEKFVQNDLLTQNDIALIKIDDPFHINEFVSIADVSGQPWPQDERMFDRSCTAVGWGWLEIYGVYTDLLQKLNVTAMHGDKACKCFPYFQAKSLICLRHNRKGGVCNGDSGGPLICNNTIVGVAHAIYNPDKCDYLKIKSSPMLCRTSIGTYTYTCPYLNWLRKYVPTIPEHPVSCRGLNISSSMLIFIFLTYIHLSV